MALDMGCQHGFRLKPLAERASNHSTRGSDHYAGSSIQRNTSRQLHLDTATPMTVNTPAANPRYALHYIGDPKTDDEVLQSLDKAGPLLVAARYVLTRRPRAWCGSPAYLPALCTPHRGTASIILTFHSPPLEFYH